ncbi:MAG: tyrosine-type recombinase/integrase [bacterium]|nr:MAG: tyrosine-type recombinase/integrase [bacterium]
MLTGKDDKISLVPIINDKFLSDLKHLIGLKCQGFVFCYNEGKQLSLMTINKIAAKAGKRTSISNPNPRQKHINPHIFRSSIPRYLKNKGFSADWIQNFLGHASYKTTMGMYGTLSIDKMQQEALNRLQE